MKKTITLLLLAFTTIVATAQTWQNVGSPGFSIGDVWDPTIAVDSTGTPYVAIRDNSQEGYATVKKFDGTNWENVGEPNFSAGEVVYQKVAINSLGEIYAIYSDQTIDAKVRVMMFNGTEWVNVGTPVSEGGTFSFDIAFSAEGMPYVAYQDVDDYYRATVKRFNGTTWQNVGSQGFSDNTADNLSLAIDPSGTPYLAFDKSYELEVMKYNGTTWVEVGGDIYDGTITNVSLAINAEGTPYIMYHADEVGISVVKLNGTSWETVGSAAFSAQYAGYGNIALDSEGTPYVSFSILDIGGGTTVMKYNGASWEYVGAPGFSEGWANGVKMAIDVNNTIYVTYQDGAYGERVTVMKAAGCADCPQPTKLEPASCGATVSQFSDHIRAIAVEGATAYRFRVTNGATTEVIEREPRVFWLSLLSSYTYATTYSVQVGAFVDGQWINYGPVCTVTSPAAPLTQLVSNKCGVTIAAFDSSIKAEPVLMAQSYRFSISGGSVNEVIESAQGLFKINMLSSYNYNTTYNVQVAVRVNNTWGAYGSSCTVTTPAPITALKTKYCGITVPAFSSIIRATDVLFADRYRFRVTNGATSEEVENSISLLRINMLSSYSYNTVYTVEVAVRVNGQWGPYGPSCTISTPASGVRQNLANDTEATVALTAYPNPFDSAFTLSLETMSDEPVSIQAYDITGKMLENRTVAVAELEGVRIGQNFASGIYSVIVSQGSYTKAVKMVKK